MANKNAVYRRFTDIEEYKSYRKQKFLFYTSFFFLVTFFGFGMSSLLIRKDYLMSLIDFITAAVMLVNLLFLTSYIRLSSTIFFISLITAQLFLVCTGGFFNLGIIWCLCQPTLAYFLKGKKTGILYLVVTILLIMLAVSAGYLGLLKRIYSYGELLYIVVVYFIVSLLTYFYAVTMENSENIIKNQLYNHSLTGLPNYNRLKLDITNGSGVTLILINIDNFKIVNDFYGNKTGDMILIDITKRIEKLAIAHSQLYKLPSDEFALLIYRMRREGEIKELVGVIETELKKPYPVEHNDVLLDFTSGLAVNSDKPLAEAKMAMHHAKQRKTNYLIYDKSMDLSKIYECNIRKMKNIRNAINSDNILIYYQPILNNSTSRVHIYECLIRLLDKHGNVILPHHFLDIAKKTKLYPAITRSLIDKSFACFKGSELDFSINLSVDDMCNSEVFDFIMHNLKEYGTGRQVIFELTESEKIENNKAVKTFINSVKKEGCRIAIDDFGSGYSNFAYILNMDIDFIKIDGALIRNLEHSRDSQIITETIVSFASKLGIDTIAEFVHSRTILEKVKSLGISYSQGFHIGKPENRVDFSSTQP